MLSSGARLVSAEADPVMNPTLFFTAALAFCLLHAGCDRTPSSPLQPLQGSWGGTEPGKPGEISVTISGNKLHFERKPDGEWYKGTLSPLPGGPPKRVRALVTASSSKRFVGKSSNFIYRIDEDSLTIAGLEPAGSRDPAGFDDETARVFVLKREGP